MEDFVMADTFPDLKGDPISDVREDLGNVPSNNESYGFTYFVDSNAGSDGNDGLSKEAPFKTLAAAITASNLTIATHPDLAGAGFAARNRIKYKGDGNTESLTVLPEKCDIIGVGSGGGFRTKPGLIGTHVIAGANSGCRIINMGFQPLADGANLWTLVNATKGIEFIDCRFESNRGAFVAGSAIVYTGPVYFRVENCYFEKDFSDAIIEILAGTFTDTMIKGNHFNGNNEGINIATGVGGGDNVVIKENTFETTLACINDVDGVAVILNNIGTTAAARGLKQAGAIVGNVLLSAGNFFTCSDGVNMPWPAPVAVWNETGGRDYYVDSNEGNAANSGTSWDDALDTLTAALALSHANIGLGSSTFAARNQIFYKGDSNSENLTTLARKTDIIGVGSGGGHRDRPAIIGTHVIDAVAYDACRFFNMGFLPEANTDDIFTIPAEVHGLVFKDCNFESSHAAFVAGSAIVVTGGTYMRIEDCDFEGAFSDSVIEVLAGNSDNMIIRRNTITGDNDGVEFLTGLSPTTPGNSPLVEENTIDVALITVNDVDAAFVRILNNILITEANEGSSALAGAVVGNVLTCAGNTVSAGNTASNTPWPVVAAGS